MKIFIIMCIFLFCIFSSVQGDDGGGVAFFGMKIRDEARAIEIMIARYKAELLDLRQDLSEEQLLWYETKFNNKLNQYTGVFKEMLARGFQSKLNQSIGFLREGKRAQAIQAFLTAEDNLRVVLDDAEAGAMITIKSEVVQ